MDALESDEAVFRRVQHGDARAFGIIFDRHKDRVFRHAHWVLADPGDAEDILAAAFLELWRRRAAVRFVDGSALPWLIATTTNLSRNADRTRQRYRRFLRDLPPPQEQPNAAEIAYSNMDSQVRASELSSAIMALSPKDSQLLFLTALEGLSIEEASRTVGISSGAAKTRISRARRKLAATLDQTNLSLGELT
jgi:RNA polymerase sigma factor (sigma-70 family)